MKITNIKIVCWRSIKILDISANDLMIIIGQNNHGKSNLLSAILFFFGEIKAQTLDFNNSATNLFVEITFGELNPLEKITFDKYLNSSEQIVVRKTAYNDGSFEYKGYIQNPIDETLQEANASAYTSQEIASTLPFYGLLPSSGRITKQQIIDAQKEYILENISSLQFTYELESSKFLGLKSLPKGCFGEIYFIPAVKEVADDFSPKETSTFGRLYSEVIKAMSEVNEEWKQTKTELNILFGKLNRVDSEGKPNSERPQQLVDFESKLSEQLSVWGTDIDIEVSPPDIDNVFRANTQVWVNDGVKTDIKRKGHGLQRALTFALINVIANRINTTPEDKSEEATVSSESSKFFVFEEPELYLHPQAQRELFDSLVKISEAGSQVILCTHSSALVNVEKYQSIYIVEKIDEAQGTSVKQCQNELFSDENIKENFNLAYWINPDRGELFFAKKVILVEGPTEKTVIPKLAESLGIFKYEYTIIDCGGKSCIPQYIKLLNTFSIPYVVVYDKDHGERKSDDAKNSADKESKNIEDEINLELGSSVVLDNDIEEELNISSDKKKNKPYTALAHISKSDFQMSRTLLDKVHLIYT